MEERTAHKMVTVAGGGVGGSQIFETYNNDPRLPRSNTHAHTHTHMDTDAGAGLGREAAQTSQGIGSGEGGGVSLGGVNDNEKGRKISPHTQTHTHTHNSVYLPLFPHSLPEGILQWIQAQAEWREWDNGGGGGGGRAGGGMLDKAGMAEEVFFSCFRSSILF